MDKAAPRSDTAIRDLLYIRDDSTIAIYLGVDVDQVAEVRAKAEKADKRIIPIADRKTMDKPSNGLGSAVLAMEQTRASSEKLLRALLLYGLKHNGLPGLTREQFYARCRETAVLL